MPVAASDQVLWCLAGEAREKVNKYSRLCGNIVETFEAIFSRDGAEKGEILHPTIFHDSFFNFF